VLARSAGELDPSGRLRDLALRDLVVVLDRTTLELGETRASSLHIDLLLELRVGGPAGKMYGMCGLYLVDRARFLEAAKAFENNQDIVGMGEGCLIVGKQMCNVVAGEIVSGEYPRMLVEVQEWKETRELKERLMALPRSQSTE